MSQTALLIGSSVVVRPYAEQIAHQGLNIATRESFDQALGEISSIRPDIIAIILPDYVETVTNFVQTLRRIPIFRNTPIVCISGMIEGADQTLLHQYNVKTLTLGPVQTDEMARFIVRQLSSH